MVMWIFEFCNQRGCIANPFYLIRLIVFLWSKFTNGVTFREFIEEEVFKRNFSLVCVHQYMNSAQAECFWIKKNCILDNFISRVVFVKWFNFNYCYSEKNTDLVY